MGFRVIMVALTCSDRPGSNRILNMCQILVLTRYLVSVVAISLVSFGFGLSFS